MQQHLSSENGGEERSLFSILKRMHENGKKVGLIYRKPGDYQQELEVMGVHCVQAGVSEFSFSNIPSFMSSVLSAYKEINGIAKRIHVNSYKDITWAAALAKLLFIPISLHLRLNAPEYLSRQYRWGIFQTDTLIANSNFVKNDWKRYVTNEIKVIWNGIPHLKSTMLEKETPAFLLVFLGRIVHEKGLQIIIEAMSKSESRFVLRVIGSDKQSKERGESEFFVGLKKRIKDLELESRVEFLGHVQNPLEILKTCDALVAPSIHDSFGRTLMEAMMLDVPVIASDCGGTSELASKHLQLNELCFPEYDDNQLAKKIDHFYSHFNKYTKAGLWKSFADQHFDISKTVSLMQDALELEDYE